MAAGLPGIPVDPECTAAAEKAGAAKGKSAKAVATESGGGSLWVIVDGDDVRGDEVPGRELWLEVFRSDDELRFGLTAIGLGGGADYLVDGVMEPLD